MASLFSEFFISSFPFYPSSPLLSDLTNHLASSEKEGDELRRNADVAEMFRENAPGRKRRSVQLLHAREIMKPRCRRESRGKFRRILRPGKQIYSSTTLQQKLMIKESEWSFLFPYFACGWDAMKSTARLIELILCFSSALLMAAAIGTERARRGEMDFGGVAGKKSSPKD
nr:hypothetical protein Iba_chr14aCG13800 [Ipomoea batatas]